MKQLSKELPSCNQAVQIWRIHPRKAERVDAVVALLVGDDQDDVGTIGHGRSRLPASAKRKHCGSGQQFCQALRVTRRN